MSKPSLAAKIRAHERSLQRGKREYKRADELLKEILERMRPGQEITLNGRRKARLKDNFAEKNTAYRALGIRRFEIEIVEPNE